MSVKLIYQEFHGFRRSNTMNRKNLMLISLMITVPLVIFLASEYILATGFESQTAPTGLITFESVRDEWDSYKYGFFETEVVSCNPDRVLSSPRMSSFEKTEALSYLAFDIAKDAESKFEKVYSLFEYVAKDILYVTYTDKWRRPTEVLETMDGDCTDKSILLVTLLTEIGIESYVVYGGADELANQHAWVVANINDEWFQMDATSEDFYYVYKCRNDENCIHEKFYNSILGVFGPDIALKCTI